MSLILLIILLILIFGGGGLFMGPGVGYYGGGGIGLILLVVLIIVLFRGVGRGGPILAACLTVGAAFAGLDAHAALAQAAQTIVAVPTAAPTFTADLSPVMIFLATTASLVITGAVPTVLTWLYVHLKISQDSIFAQRLKDFITAAAQMGAAEIQSLGTHNVTLTTKSQIAAKYANLITTGAETARVALGVTPAQVAQRVDGELGAKLGTAGVTISS